MTRLNYIFQTLKPFLVSYHPFEIVHRTSVNHFQLYSRTFISSRSMSTVSEHVKVQIGNDQDVDNKRKIDEISAVDKANSDPDKEKETQSIVKKSRKIRLKKYALLISYCGAGYFGLQRNDGFKTIESEIFDSLLKADIIIQEQYDKPSKIYFQRAARTDKGVSAIRQILSLRLPDFVESEIENINKFLPPQIRLIAARRVTNYFDSKNYCDARTYAYLMPTFAIAGFDETCSIEYRVGEERFKKFSEVLSVYKGTHNFHNFTSQKSFNEMSANRYIISIECSEPFERDSMEFIVVRIKGQSFMLHQIRKMIGLALGIMRGCADAHVIEKAFKPAKLDIPKAPGLGLMLEHVHYDSYARKKCRDGVHEELEWSQYNQVLTDFRDKYIYDHIVKTEAQESSMLKWLQLLPLHTYDERASGPPIPITNDVLDTLYKPANFRSDYKMAAFNSGLFHSSNESFHDVLEESANDKPASNNVNTESGDAHNEKTEEAARIVPIEKEESISTKIEEESSKCEEKKKESINS